jgi:hypothetical protein
MPEADLYFECDPVLEEMQTRTVLPGKTARVEADGANRGNRGWMGIEDENEARGRQGGESRIKIMIKSKRHIFTPYEASTRQDSLFAGVL